MKIGLVDVGIGNLGSLKSALEKLQLNFKNCNEAKDFESINKLIVPGVGNFRKFMEVLKSRNMDKIILEKNKKNIPILGICLGYQIYFEESEEKQKTKGLGILKGVFKNLSEVSESIKVPHTGWNECSFKKKSPLFEGILDNSDFYFTHKYYLKNYEEDNVMSLTNYHIDIVSSVSKNNIYGVQFHPEKSQKNGLKLLKNFVENC